MTAIEIAASAAIAIRIGIRGEEPPPLPREAGSTGWLVCCTEVAGVPAEPFPGLPWPVPPSLFSVAALPDVEDGLPVEDFAPEDPDFVVMDASELDAEALPPFALDDLAGVSWWTGVFPPVAVGGASEY